MKDVVIAAIKRTAIGTFGGSLQNVSAVDLGVTVTKAVLEQAGISGDDIDEVILGQVLQGGQGQNSARQILIKSGIPQEKGAITINKVCGSGLRSISLAAQIIKAGDADVVLAGGVENMSQAPYLLPTNRWGGRMGNVEAVDMMIKDGLWDAFNNYHMGITAENIAEKWGFTREECDAFSAGSQNKAEAAIKEGRFKDEIVPVEIPQRKGDPVIFDTDEFPKFGSTAEGLGKLRPAFKKDGVVTAGNASGINDGAAIAVVMSADKAQELGVTPLVTIKAYASAGVDPAIMGTGPIPSTRKALEKAGWTVDDLDLIEANEAFASQAMSVNTELGWDLSKVNVNGGAIALGHPIGASGSRILTTLIYEMIRRDAKKGCATLCIGGGQGTALLVER